MRGLIRLTGLWKSKSREGDKYLTGSISPTSRLLILPNKDKQRDSDPDWIAYLAPPTSGKEEKQQEESEQLSLLDYFKRGSHE